MSNYYESVRPSVPGKPHPLGRRPLVTAAWCAAWVAVLIVIVLSARLGVRVAYERRPASIRAAALAPDEEMTVAGSVGKPLVLASEQRQLREYYFRESSIPGTGLEGIDDGSVFEHRSALGIRVLATDADLVQVEIVSGPRVGERFWMEVPPVPPEDAESRRE